MNRAVHPTHDVLGRPRPCHPAHSGAQPTGQRRRWIDERCPRLGSIDIIEQEEARPAESAPVPETGPTRAPALPAGTLPRARGPDLRADQRPAPPHRRVIPPPAPASTVAVSPARATRTLPAGVAVDFNLVPRRAAHRGHVRRRRSPTVLGDWLFQGRGRRTPMSGGVGGCRSPSQVSAATVRRADGPGRRRRKSQGDDRRARPEVPIR